MPHRCLAFHSLVQVLVPIIHGFPLSPFDSLKNGLAESVPVLVNQWRLPSFISHTCGVDRGAQNTFFMSLQGDLNRAFPKNSSREICREPWLHHILGPRFFLQLPDLYCRISVNCNQLPEPAHYFAPTFLQQTSQLDRRQLSAGFSRVSPR